MIRTEVYRWTETDSGERTVDKVGAMWITPDTGLHLCIIERGMLTDGYNSNESLFWRQRSKAEPTFLVRLSTDAFPRYAVYSRRAAFTVIVSSRAHGESHNADQEVQAGAVQANMALFSHARGSAESVLYISQACACSQSS